MHSRVKLSARIALSGAYLKILPLLTLIVFTVFIFSLGNSVLNSFHDTKYLPIVFSVISLILFVLITAPARLRLEIRYFMLARGIKNSALKTDFSELKKSVFFYPFLFCLKTFWFAAFEAIPVFGTVLLYIYISGNSLSVKASVTFLIGIAVLAVTGFGFYSVFIQRYSKAAFYLVSYKDFSPLDAIRESVRKTHGDWCGILLFKLGFFPWFLLCAGVVPMLFVIPYYKQSLTIYFLE